MKTTMRFTGGKELAAALAGLSTRVSRRVQRQALDTAAQPMARRMSQLAPHEPGAPDLRDDIAVGTNAQGQDAQETAVAVGPTRHGFYGSFQELGTAHHAAQPFARPAFDETAGKALALIGDAFWVELAGRGISRSGSASGPVTGGPGGALL